MNELTEVEVRVLGSLLEKSLTTPEYYPMTANAVMNACNQKSSREPLMSLDETTVVRALISLREKGLAFERSENGQRVPKYAHRFENVIAGDSAQVATLCVLMLRGPQTPGEIRGRTGRMHVFQNPAEVESTLRDLADRAAGALVEKLTRQSGTKESRYRHLLAGRGAAPAPAEEWEPPAASSLENRLAELERRVAALEARAAAKGGSASPSPAL